MQAQPNDAKEARPMQVAGGLADRQCSKSSGALPCLPSFTDSLSHTVQLVYTSSGPYDTQSFLKVFVDHNPQPVLTTFINIDECAVSSADHLLCAHFFPFSLVTRLTAVLFRYVGFTVGKGQVAGPIVLENVSFAPSGGVMNITTLIIFCVFSFMIALLQGNVFCPCIFSSLTLHSVMHRLAVFLAQQGVAAQRAVLVRTSFLPLRRILKLRNITHLK